MKLRGMERLRGVARRLRQQMLRQQVQPKAIILIYHRVVQLPADPYLLAVTPEHFSEHLEVLRRHYQPMRLDKLIAARRADRLPKHAVAVTLDDGYYDCLHYARPLFERHDVPATVFVVSGRVADGRAFWWDELESLLLQAGELPGVLPLYVNGREHPPLIWELGEAAHYSRRQQILHQTWNYAMANAPTERQRLFRRLWQMLHAMPEERREYLMEQLFAWAGVERKTPASHRALTPAEVQRLTAGGLVEIGAHTVTHPSLAKLSVTAQQQQIERSKADLEKLSGQPVASFSYPHGQRGDFTEETAALVERAGFAGACAAYAGVVTRETNRFQLPRNGVPDCDGDAFARRMAELFAE